MFVVILIYFLILENSCVIFTKIFDFFKVELSKIEAKFACVYPKIASNTIKRVGTECVGISNIPISYKSGKNENQL